MNIAIDPAMPGEKDRSAWIGLRDFSCRYPRRAGLAMSLESYTRASGLTGLAALAGWQVWGLIFLGCPPGDVSVPIPGFAPADVIEVEP